jgi:hypothetical protein
VSAADVASARLEWEDGNRRFEGAARDPAQSERLHAQLETVTDELRKRVGGTFTLRELAAAYRGSESWIRAAVSEQAAGPGWPRSLAMVGDAAFHLYSRGAVDYEP